MTALEEMIARLENLGPEEQREIAKEARSKTKQIWVPNPGPQTDAYFSEADVLLYGGEPGGGKSSLLIGLAFTLQYRSLIMRRQYTDLGHIIEEVLRFNEGKSGWNGSPPPQLKRPDGKVIDLGAAAKVGDEQHWQGNPHDFIGIDEATQFAKQQIEFLMGWLRSTIPGQRKRVVMATNPPLQAEGLWIVEMFAPWLDEKFDKPAKPGELRWAITGEEDRLIWLDGPEPVDYNGRVIEPKSYTFIPASLGDNPFLANTGYKKNLDSMPDSLREALMGGFKQTFRDAAWQVIPTEWIRISQDRWRNDPPDVPMCAIGVDCTGGGSDPLVIAPRYDGWYMQPIEVKPKDIPPARITQTTVAEIINVRRDQCDVIIDLGGGYGTGTYEMLDENGVDVIGYKGAETTTRRSKEGNLKFTNVRSAALWGMREALDPEQPGGQQVTLPPGRKLLADLTAPTYKVGSGGITVKSKVDVCKDLGRSTNDGDAVIMAWFYGKRSSTHALDFIERGARRTKRGQAPRVITGRALRTGRR